MDPVMKMYMFYHWLEDNNEQVELFKNHGYLIGSFTNPEAVKKMLDGNTYSISDDDFDKASEMVHNTIKQQIASEEVNIKRRRRKKIH